MQFASLNDGIFLNQNVMNIRVSRIRLLSLWNFEALFWFRLRL
jgi:hypothetical protein